MKKLLCPSMMCADAGNLGREMHALESAGADLFHLDVMDGRFVPNFAMGLGQVATLCAQAGIPCDVHLMIENPANYVDLFAGLGAAILYIHPEADPDPRRTLEKIAAAGAKPGLAVSPDTPVDAILPLLPLVDYLLLMCVYPGFAGQAFIPGVEGKAIDLIARKGEFGYRLILDGACSPERIAHFSALGADGFVLGAASLFGKGEEYGAILPRLAAL